MAYQSIDFGWSLTVPQLAVAYVLSNWDNVIRAITLASSKRYFPALGIQTDFYPVIGKAGGLYEPTESDGKNVEKPRNDPRLPSMLVRIPAEPCDKTGE